MTVRRYSGRTKMISLPKASAVAIDAGEFLKFNGAGKVIACISDTNEGIVGISRDSHATSDTGTGLIPVEVPIEQYVEFEIDTDSDGGLADSDVGNYRDLDITGGNLDASASTDKVLLVVKKISATKGVVMLAKSVVNSFNPSIVIST